MQRVNRRLQRIGVVLCLALGVAGIVGAIACGPGNPAAAQPATPPLQPEAPKYQPAVVALGDLLDSRSGLSAALDEAIQKADIDGISNRAEYFHFLDDMVTLVPEWPGFAEVRLKFFWIIGQSNLLETDPAFQAWTLDFIKDWGSFLNTPASAAHIASFKDSPDFSIDDYFVGPSGWLTFNQFFARQLKAGRRPIEALCDDDVVVSAADSRFKHQFEINDDAVVVLKGVEYRIKDLLAGSKYSDEFDGGLYVHSYLSITDYHRYHSPVRGKVLEVDITPGVVSLEVTRSADGKLEAQAGDRFQFTQVRGRIIFDSPVGLVAMVPVGMSVVQSVIINVDPGATVGKGDELGYFLFGGSDIALLFQKDKVEIEAEEGKHISQGQVMARKIAK